MIDPHNPPHISTASTYELEEFLLFSAAVAGKHASRTAASLANWLAEWKPKYLESPFSVLAHYTTMGPWTPGEYNDVPRQILAKDLKRHGMGCYNARARTFLEIYWSFINRSVREASFKQLVKIWGIGLKTASFFLAYTGIDEDRVILDTHILQWLKEQGWPRVPKATPKSMGKYEELELYFRAEAAKREITLLELDKEIWQARAK